MPTVNKPVRPWMKPKIKAPDNNQGRENANRKLYGSQRWRNDSLAHRRENPLCKMCLDEGRLTDGTISDHIVPVNQGGDVWDWSNRQNLCYRCHQKKSRSERK